MALASASSGSRRIRVVAALMFSSLPRTGVFISPFTPRSSSLSTHKTRMRSTFFADFGITSSPILTKYSVTFNLTFNYTLI